jgi:hypothetical protein
MDGGYSSDLEENWGKIEKVCLYIHFHQLLTDFTNLEFIGLYSRNLKISDFWIKYFLKSKLKLSSQCLADPKRTFFLPYFCSNCNFINQNFDYNIILFWPWDISAQISTWKFFEKNLKVGENYRNQNVNKMNCLWKLRICLCVDFIWNLILKLVFDT